MAMRWAKLYRGTPAELALEPAVAAIGVPYRTQFPAYLYGLRYFPDFYLPTLGLVIEVDDRSHEAEEKQLADAERSARLKAEWGVRVVRCRNDEALEDPHGTVQRLLREASITPAEIDRARRANLATRLPRPRRAPQKEKRAAILEARRGARTRTPRPGPPPPPETAHLT